MTIASGTEELGVPVARRDHRGSAGPPVIIFFPPENQVLDSTLAGLQRENVIFDAEIRQLRGDYQSLLEAYAVEVAGAEEVRAKIQQTRREIGIATRDHAELQSRLRSSRTAGDLVADR